MRNFLIRAVAAAAGALALSGVAAETGTGARSDPFLPIEYRHLPLPPDVHPQWPIFAEGGREILFQNAGDATVWIVGVDGDGLRCLTCSVPRESRPRGGGFVHPFKDGRRLLITDGVASAADLPKGSNGWVLECKTRLRDCTVPKLLPVDMSADRGKAIVAQRRTFHLAPDGEHIGWMNVRTDGTVMIVARLKRAADRYIAADPRAVNPVGPRSEQDDSADRWENWSQLYELKSFTPDGKAIIAVGTPNNNVDILRIELADGEVTRLTAHPDWDEDSSFSPDQDLLVVGSWRGAHRLDSLAWIPQIRGFTGLMTGAAIAPYYVSTWEGFQCDLTPWLLPSRGDDDGRLMGQPVAVYQDPTLTAANNVQGQRVWSPDSTMILLHERLRDRGSSSPSRITIAKLDRAPAAPVRAVRTEIGDWAVPAAVYEGPFARDHVAVVRGRSSGVATITYTGRLGGGGSSTSVIFDHFSDDGATFVDGTMSGAAAKTGDGERRAWLLRADVTVSGAHTGKLEMDLTLDNGAKPLPKMEGTMRAVYDGNVAAPLPELAPCYANQPKPTPLQLALRRDGRRVLATVTATIDGDMRPVRNATVRAGRQVFKTDFRGQAALTVPKRFVGQIRATAGDTFVPVSVASAPEGGAQR